MKKRKIPERQEFVEFLERLLMNLQPPASFALASANLEITRALIKSKIEELGRKP
jgi:hypothetical protein